MKNLLRDAIAKGIDYQTYITTAKTLLDARRSSPSDQDEASPKMQEYTSLNLARMSRLDKTISIGENLQAQLYALQSPITFLLISEAWCGDAAQNVPLIAKMADSVAAIDLRIVWRDSNLELMDNFLTRGGRGIPKLVILDSDSLEVLATWGPRPAAAQALVDAHKANPQESYDEFVKNLHLWYTKDKTISQQSEFQAIFANLLAKVNV